MAKDDLRDAAFSSSNLSGYEQNRLYYEGDHWQNSKGYMGQKPLLSNKNYGTILCDIKEGFVSENVIKEVVDAHLNGVVGRNPDWQMIDGEKKLPDAIDNSLIDWWDNKDALGTVKEAAQRVVAERKTLVRLFVPFGYLNESGLEILPKFADAVRYAHYQVVNREKGGVYMDSARMMPFSVYNYSRKIGKKEVAFAELSFTDDENLTHLITFKDIKSFEPEDLLAAGKFSIAMSGEIDKEAAKLYAKIDAAAPADPIDLKGHLYLFELEGTEFITEQIRSLQRMINLARTMGGKNINVAGVRQRDYLNAKKPDIVASGASANFLYGIPIQDENGKTIGMTSPNVSITDPSDPSYFIKTRDDAYAAILGQCGQKHRLIASDGNVGVDSRIDARSEFIASLKKTATVLDKFGRWLIETKFYFTLAFCNETVEGNFRCAYRTVIDAGSVDVETRKLDQADVQENRLDLETYLSKTGNEDPASILVRIKNQAPQTVPPTNPANV